MMTMLDNLAIDRSDRESRISMRDPGTKAFFSNHLDAEMRSDTAAARPHEARHRLVQMWGEAALRHAYLRESADPPGFVATVAGLSGVWASGASRGAALEELLDVLVDWAAIKLDDGDDDIPVIDGVCVYPSP